MQLDILERTECSLKVGWDTYQLCDHVGQVIESL